MSDTIEHTARETKKPNNDGLYVTDAELIRRLGVPEKIARAALHMLDKERHRGFPQKQKLWGDRRYWPAVKAFLDRTGGLTMDASTRRSNHG